MFREKQTALEAYVQAGLPGSELVFENQPSPSPDLFDEWIRINVLNGDSKRMQIGGNGYRHPGIVTAQIFLREGIGIDRGVELADAVSTLMRDKVISGVNTQVPYITKNPVAEAGWFQVQVTIPFYFDEVN